MILRKWDDLPDNMKTEAVRPYYEYLKTKKIDLFCKFLFDRVMAVALLIILFPVFLWIAYLIHNNSEGNIFFKQKRITRYGNIFEIYKFRTMVNDAESIGTQVTIKNDFRITSIGGKLRKYRLDELPQLINILRGEMSFVGTRPEVPKYVIHYTPEMMVTLLLPAGVTSETSIKYKDENCILKNSDNADQDYLKKVLPAKMQWNLEEIKKFSIFHELKVLISTIGAVL